MAGCPYQHFGTCRTDNRHTGYDHAVRGRRTGRIRNGNGLIRTYKQNNTFQAFTTR